VPLPLVPHWMRIGALMRIQGTNSETRPDPTRPDPTRPAQVPRYHTFGEQWFITDKGALTPEELQATVRKHKGADQQQQQQQQQQISPAVPQQQPQSPGTTTAGSAPQEGSRGFFSFHRMRAYRWVRQGRRGREGTVMIADVFCSRFFESCVWRGGSIPRQLARPDVKPLEGHRLKKTQMVTIENPANPEEDPLGLGGRKHKSRYTITVDADAGWCDGRPRPADALGLAGETDATRRIKTKNE
jgi:hypothetical protein